MTMKRSDVESVSTIIVNIGTIIYWVLSAVTAVVLNLQPQPIVLPGFFELGAAYKLIFYVSLFLGYIQLLKKNWETSKRRGKDVEGTFGSYLFGSVFKFKRPIVFIGFITILGIIGVFLFAELSILAFFIALFGFAAIVSFLVNGGWNDLVQRYDDDFRKRWLKRVRNRLYENGHANTSDFLDLPDTEVSEIEWAITTYFRIYEFEQDLLFREKFYREGTETIRVFEIRFKHVLSHLPNE
jgi:hypothetical protein